MNDLVEISKKILSDCLGVKPDEKYLVVTDDYEEELASYLYKAGKELGLVSMLFKILPLSIKYHGDGRLCENQQCILL